MKLLSQPSVDKAVENLQASLMRLDEAIEAHSNKATEHSDEAKRIRTLADQEFANAERAMRIRSKLSAILA